jgi:AraC-like DNA-binding protein
MTNVAHTADHPPTERLDYWRSTLSEAFVPLEAMPNVAAVGRIRGSLRYAALSTMHIADVRGSAQTVRRSSALIRRQDPGWVKIGLQMSGHGRLSQDDREVELAPGDLAAYDTARPYTLTFPGTFQMFVLMCPRSSLRLSSSELTRATAVRISGRAGVGALVSPFLARLGAMLNQPGPTMGDRTGQYLADSVIDMLAAGLIGATEDGETSITRQDLLLGQIQDYIEAHLHQAGLSPVTIAAEHHISVRYLQKLFARHSWTVGSWMRTRRLEHCRRDLRDPGLAQLPVSGIAVRRGLTDAAHFSRIFRVTYGATPSEYRRSTESSKDL